LGTNLSSQLHAQLNQNNEETVHKKTQNNEHNQSGPREDAKSTMKRTYKTGHTQPGLVAFTTLVQETIRPVLSTRAGTKNRMT